MKLTRLLSLALLGSLPVANASATIDGSLDPDAVVAQWSDTTTYTQIIDINFSDDSWPSTWAGETGRDCPSYDDGGYVNAIIEVEANGGTGDITYPVYFHHCTFATKESYNGYAGATAAFCRQYYLGESYTGNSSSTYNNWTVEGHTTYLEDNITYDDSGTPNYGEAGFVQMCRDASTTTESMHGWMEIDHIPYVERLQWSWSSTSWGRGIKCDYKVGSGDWQPLVWMGSEKQKKGYTVFSDQGYFMENVIDDYDVSIRWRVWDGDTCVQLDDDGNSIFDTEIDSLAQKQAPRVHKIKIYGNEISESDAEYARNNPVSDVGELSDLSEYESSDDEDTSSDTDDDDEQILAFPTAEGFGKYASGGRGGEVVYVTSLDDGDDDDEGTLRWAVKQYENEPLTIEFAVSGEIALQSELEINRADWTLAGQTAPGDGIVITHNKVNVGGSENFIVRNVRFRVGQNDADGNVLMENALGAENCSNFIFDHCSFGWSVEENMNTADSHFLTVQYSMVHEGLYNAGHSKGSRGYGAQWGGSPATYHHNLLAHNHSRSPRFNGARGEDYVVFIEYINNVNYNFGGTSGCYGGENTADITSYNGLNSAHECNFMNNYYKPGAASDSDGWIFFTSSYARSGATSWAPAQWYVDGNIIEGDDEANEDNWSAVEVETYTLDDIRVDERIVTETPYYKYTSMGVEGSYVPEDYMIYDYETAEDAYNTVVNTAGTVNRDAVEERIADEALNGTYTYTGSVSGLYGIIDLETDAEGFFDYSTDYDVPTDTDGDGMPDEWEEQYGLNPDSADQNYLNADGYTALEVYLNSLMGEEMDTNFTNGITNVALEAPTIGFDPSTNTLTVSDNAIGGTLRVYATNGVMLSSQTITSAQTKLERVPDGVLLLQITGKGLRPRIVKTAR